MTIVHRAEARRTATPNATMTTCASPTQGGTAGLAVWRVEMAAGAAGPLHTFDGEQVWTVLSGTATVEVDGVPHPLGPGDTVVLPPHVPRQVHADVELTALVASVAGARATQPGAAPVLPPWVA